MKAENILKSNLQSKIIIFYNFFLQKTFCKKIFVQPQKFIFFTCFKHQKWNLHEGLTLLTSSKTKRQAFEVAMG